MVPNYPDFSQTWTKMSDADKKTYVNAAIERMHETIYNQNIAFFNIQGPAYASLSVADKALVRQKNLQYYKAMQPLLLAIRKQMLGK